MKSLKALEGRNNFRQLEMFCKYTDIALNKIGISVSISQDRKDIYVHKTSTSLLKKRLVATYKTFDAFYSGLMKILLRMWRWRIECNDFYEAKRISTTIHIIENKYTPRRKESFS